MIQRIGMLYLPHFLELLAGAMRGFLMEARADMTACQISTHRSFRMLARPLMISTNMNPETQESG